MGHPRPTRPDKVVIVTRSLGFLTNRISVVSAYVAELFRRGLPEFVGDMDREFVVLLDGVGGFQFVPLLARKVLREAGAKIGSTWFRWQVAIPGLILVDLMWYRRNRLMAAKLARKLLALRRAHREATIHIVSFSGGTGIAVFALERLRGRVPIETLVLACPAISREFNLGPALRGVKRCYALVSCRDRWLLGVGTRLFGTMDRRHERSAGLVGFAHPEGLTATDAEAYSRMREIHWSPEMREDGHAGGHTGWANVPFLRRHLLPILAGKPLLAVRTLDSGGKAGNN